MNKKKKLARVIATWLVTGIMASVFLLDIITVFLGNKYVNAIPIKKESFTNEYSDDKIHFLNTANSDCILLESNGHFAIVDSGEGNNNPRKKTEYKGYEEDVIGYIKKICGDSNGQVQLDFILATHMHYDHSGNFEPIIKNPDIHIKTAYVKTYDADATSEMDSESWGNLETYKKIIAAIEEREIELIQQLPDCELEFGDFILQFFNTTTPESVRDAGENASSVGVKVTKGTKSAFLAADFTNNSGMEMLFAKEIGDIDLLKIGHHGYFGSSSPDFLRETKPEITVCTNHIGKIYPNVKWNITMVARAPIFSTAHRNGIIAHFTDDNEIKLTEDIM